MKSQKSAFNYQKTDSVSRMMTFIKNYKHSQYELKEKIIVKSFNH